MKTILIIDDDTHIGNMLEEALSKDGYRVSRAYSGTEALLVLSGIRPDLILLDLMLPGLSGEDVLPRLKGIPVIVVSAKVDIDNKVDLLLSGAVDYVTKPFELEVLHSRIHALLRRAGNVQNQYLSCSSISIDKNKTAVFCSKEEIAVSQAEYQLLQLLMENKGKTITREQLLTQIWDNNGNYVNDNTLTVTMKRLREKLHHPSCIKTIRSFGYRMEDT